MRAMIGRSLVLECGTAKTTYADGRVTYHPVVDGLRFADEFETQDEAFAAAKQIAEDDGE